MPTKIEFKKKNIIIIGGAGFIGSWLCKELIKHDNLIICIDDLSGGSEKNIDQLLSMPDFRFIKHNMNEKINLEDEKDLGDIDFKFQGIQEIYHLAALMSPRKFEETKLDNFLTNIESTKNALDLAVKYKSKFLFTSSSVVYGKRPNDKTFFQEDYFGYVDPISPRSCYDEGKRAAESLVSIYHEKYNLETKIARIFRTYGPGMNIKEGHMLPDFVLSALDGKPLTIHGDENFSTSLCYVTDIVDGIIKLMDQNNNIGPINLGSDQDYNLTHIAEKIIKIAEEFSPLAKNSSIVYGNSLLFMTPLGLPSIAKAKEKLGWLPIMTLEKGLRNLIDYITANKDLLELDI